MEIGPFYNYPRTPSGLALGWGFQGMGLYTRIWAVFGAWGLGVYVEV